MSAMSAMSAIRDCNQRRLQSKSSPAETVKREPTPSRATLKLDKQKPLGLVDAIPSLPVHQVSTTALSRNWH